MVYRVYVEKKPAFADEAKALCTELREILQIRALKDVRIWNRYDVQGLTEETFLYAVQTVLSEPAVDTCTFDAPDCKGAQMLCVEYLPGQFDQRADSAAECIQLLCKGERPLVKTAKVYLFYGELDQAAFSCIQKYLINPVEARQADPAPVTSLQATYPEPAPIQTVEGFCAMDDLALEALAQRLGLAMDLDDVRFCRDYFCTEQRDPTLTELRVIDTYWSDHCRHTTFLTQLDDVQFADDLLQKTWQTYQQTRTQLDSKKPICLMDVATLAAKYLVKTGRLDRLDASEEINACTVKIDVERNGKKEPWLLLFKNETHNHPTEIEPFGGAATCIGGAIRDPLSGRAYVYGAMRLTGAADPRQPVEKTLPGKLPQRKIVTTAAAGYASYGNQIGLATGIVDELYHPGYLAKHMELGAVIAAAPAEQVRRAQPQAGDVVILLGGKTGRDGCGGATGSSKSHTVQSLEHCGAEVQKGNAVQERKLQRFFKNPKACQMIKRCNDFGAGGVCVAIGELAEGLRIDLDAVPKKYEGLDGTELAISESQERMAVVVAAEDAAQLIELAQAENLLATPVAQVCAEPRLMMCWRGETVVNLRRAFLDTNGAQKHTRVAVAPAEPYSRPFHSDFVIALQTLAADLNVCDKRGLGERFDSTIGAGAVLMPYGGVRQITPVQAMVQKIPVPHGQTNTCSVMAWGYNPYISEKSPYHGAYLAVVESVSKLIAAGASFSEVYLTLQEYFPRPGKDPARWGAPLAALLGAFAAQMDLGVGAIGGKDSMSGSFEELDVPPTLVSFAVTTEQIEHIVCNTCTHAGERLVLLRPQLEASGLPNPVSQKALYEKVSALIHSGVVQAAYTPGYGGVAEAVMKMCFGNGFGFCFDAGRNMRELFDVCYGAFVLSVRQDVPDALPLGVVTAEQSFCYRDAKVGTDVILQCYCGTLEGVYPMQQASADTEIPTLDEPAELQTPPAAPAVRTAKPLVLIPVFPGTNCEYDSAAAVEEAGALPELLVLNNLSPERIEQSVAALAASLRRAQMLFIPGGFSGADEPDGSGKFITAVFRNAAVRAATEDLLDRRGGLILGVCNGFQALIKLGLVPFGKIVDPNPTAPTLTYNRIGRHQSKIVRTRIVTNRSPWLRYMHPGDIVSVPISHGEGRFIASDAQLAQLAANGQIATQYVDAGGRATDQIAYNPNNSAWAVEGITSPDGRVFGKMGHSERIGNGLYKNVPGEYDIHLFKAAVAFFKE